MDSTDEAPWIDLFLRQLRGHGLINAAATTAGVTARTVNRLREADAEFDYAVESALEAAADELELEARRRAVDGVDKGIYYQGERVGDEVIYSDTLLTTLLKAKRADEFAERKQITGANGTPLTVVVRTFGEPEPDDTRNVIEGSFVTLPPPAAVDLAEVLDMV